MRRWDIVETRHVLKRKTADGVKCVNNYRLQRTLGQGRFAKVKLCERIATPPAETTTTTGDDDGDLPPPPPPPSSLSLKAAPQPPPPSKGREFAVKIFSKKSLVKIKEYVSQRVDGEDAARMRVVTALDRVRDEVQIMRSLYHRNIVLLFEVIEAEDDDKIYLVLEYMPTGPCMVFKKEAQEFTSPITQGVLTEELAQAHTRDILNGLSYLHRRGICHRDLKPDNILLNTTGRCHLSDFGCALACSVDKRGDILRPLVTDTIGTYQFLAPECCSGEPYDPFAVDVWAVGMILFIFLFGKLPFEASGTKELFDEITSLDIAVHLEGREIPPQCRDLLVRLLQRNASDRITLAAALGHPWLVEDDNEEPLSF
ncbi:hypothetical protein Poli38472_006380 [Pythium oligandrum]|uniref:Protein kinase domain-containing protein n=1 Tax=Pythium oligandrum TaxID=41045 RepID=A0A8K1FAL8_PYTOL|nr:hypothetical protein Poli38472_006380 [Pythium oligandrum]|eukprot:TMW56370.1 hypothetical protein Poli38472_006380 [Pythium oligandrum]